MTIRIGFVMDPIESIKTYKDTTFAMMLAAQARGWQLCYIKPHELSCDKNRVKVHYDVIEVTDNTTDWFRVLSSHTAWLHELDVIMMRKDPPFNLDYIYLTYFLELAQQQGALVVNDPRSLRDANEKVFTTHFPQCTPPTLISSQANELRAFHAEHGDIILKPLDGMGGSSIFRVQPADPNLNVIIETLTAQGKTFCMAQRYIPDISKGDKRIFMLDGEPMPYCLARIPSQGETRGNLAAGGKGVAQPLSERDCWIANEVGPELKRRGILFAGIDVIGDYLTEINVTSPTCVREVDAAYDLDIMGNLMDIITKRLSPNIPN